MLAKYFRFHVYNDTDQTITYNDGGRIEVEWIPWYYSGGAVAFAAEVSQTTDFLDTGESVAASNAVEGAVVDNSSNVYVGLKGTFYIQADVTSTDGAMYLYLEESTDNARWPSDLDDYDVQEDLIFVTALELTTDAADEDRAVNFEL
jgi:hypothetical protein